jgi:hypothetical protein
MNLKINQQILLLLLLTIVSCANVDSSSDNPEEIKIHRFENFPNSFFLDLNFSNFHENETKLLGHQFVLNDELFISKNDSIITTLNNEDKALTLYLSSSEYLDNSENVFQYFSSKSDSVIGAENLAELWFFENNYKMLFFNSKTEIRIEFTEL